MTGVTNSVDDRLERVADALHEVNVSLESVRVSLGSLARVCEDHEERLRVIERWRHNLTPVVALVTFVLGSVFTALLRRFV